MLVMLTLLWGREQAAMPEELTELDTDDSEEEEVCIISYWRTKETKAEKEEREREWWKKRWGDSVKGKEDDSLKIFELHFEWTQWIPQNIYMVVCYLLQAGVWWWIWATQIIA